MGITELLELMVKRNASDIHLKVGSPPLIRVDGRLLKLNAGKLSPTITHDIAYKLMNPRHQQRFEQNNDVDFAYSVPGLARFRANIFKARGTVGIVLRTISTQIKNLPDLNMPEDSILQLLSQPRGLVLVTGTTGSGKSTTLAAMIDHLNITKEIHIMTIEDPIEFLHKDKKGIVNQREIGEDTTNYATALKYVVRQDPDAILIGECRDLVTIDAAVSAAETGHLVFTTLHTLNATQTLNRIINFYPPHQHEQIRRQLATVLNGIVSMRLLPCKSGQGRIPAVEILLNTPYIKKLILDPERTVEIPTAIKDGRKQYGMLTFDQSVQDLWSSKQISYEVALEASPSPEEFMLFSKGFTTNN